MRDVVVNDLDVSDCVDVDRDADEVIDAASS